MWAMLASSQGATRKWLAANSKQAATGRILLGGSEHDRKDVDDGHLS